MAKPSPTTSSARIKKLGGGVAVQDRMHFQGESYWKRYGAQTRQMPPIRKMLDLGVPVGLGTDGTRVSQLQPLAVGLLGSHRQDRGRHEDLAGQGCAEPLRGACADDDR
jgi:predicted amidohydrolase YtcJ